MRVMFVDDEPQILKGIARMLDSADVDWDVITATSGEAALDEMTVKAVDVVVSDMKMSGMDGAELLEKVSRLYPSTVRIILSGQSSKAAAFRAVEPMHQYLAKPCEALKLRETIARSCSLRNVLQKTKSHDFMGNISRLPSLPDIYQKVVQEIESPDGTLEGLGKLLSQDLAMTAKIMQLANSAIFGLQSTVNSPVQAASLIGMDAIRSLVLSVSVFSSFDGDATPGFTIEDISKHSLYVGGLCQKIAKCEGLDRDMTNEAFTAGLLHDIGKLIFASHAYSDFANALALSSSQNIPSFQAEKEVLGIGHDYIGGYLLSLWGLPQSIVEGVAFHHSLTECKGTTLTTPAIVYIANYLGTAESARHPQQTDAFNELVSELGLMDRVPVWSPQGTPDED